VRAKRKVDDSESQAAVPAEDKEVELPAKEE